MRHPSPPLLGEVAADHREAGGGGYEANLTAADSPLKGEEAGSRFRRRSARIGLSSEYGVGRAGTVASNPAYYGDRFGREVSRRTEAA